MISALLDTKDMLQRVYSVTYKATNDENLNPTIFYVTDPTVIFCELEHARNGHAPQLNVNTV